MEKDGNVEYQLRLASVATIGKQMYQLSPCTPCVYLLYPLFVPNLPTIDLFMVFL